MGCHLLKGSVKTLAFMWYANIARSPAGKKTHLVIDIDHLLLDLSPYVSISVAYFPRTHGHDLCVIELL